MEEPSVCVTTADLRMATADSPSRIRSTMSTPKSPSESSDDCEAPEFKCAICLGRLRNKSLIDSCFHEFCFECLVEWSKVKAECPLCKTKFDYIIHNVKSNDDYEKYHCQNNQQEGDMQIPWIEDPNRSFRYRTTMTPQLQERLAVQQIVAVRERNTAVSTRARSRWAQSSGQNVPDFRSSVYRHNLWVQPLSDVTNRFRECSPLFYRENPAQVYRLVRWLQRELMVLLPLNCPHRTFVMQTIINNVFQHPIRSPFFATQLQPYLGANTRHFIHEFAEYARSPFDMGGHDRAATYVPHGPGTIEEVVLNSPTNSDYSEGNLDDLIISSSSDVEIIDSGILPLAPVAGPSGVTSRGPPPRDTKSSSSSKHSRKPILPLSNEETHEIISSSSSDECEVLGTFKPPTPEVIDIISDEDDDQLPDQTNGSSTYLKSSHSSRERVVSCQGDGEISPRSERSLDSAAGDPGHLENGAGERPRLIVKIESGRIKRKAKRRRRKRRRRHRDTSSSRERSSSSESSGEERGAGDRKGYRGRWSWSEDSRSDYDPGGEKERRIPSVVVPQPSFKVEASSSRLGEQEGGEVVSNMSDKDDVGGCQKGECDRDRRKRKKSKHSRRHKKSRRDDDDDAVGDYAEDWGAGEGTSGSGGGGRIRCKTCRHKRCRCFKKIKDHRRRETTTEERESASGSSRSRSKGKRHSKVKYYDDRYSDSSD